MLALLSLSGCNHRKSYSLVFGGDVMLARGGQPLAAGWQEIDLSLPADVLDAGERNLYMAALESPLTSGVTEIATNTNADMNLCAAAEQVKVLENAGFDLLTFNNNHQEDCSPGGAAETERLLKESGFAPQQHIGSMWITRVEHSNLVILAIEDVMAPVNAGEVAAAIREEKVKGNFVVLSVHWGNEYQAGPDRRQQELAQTWADAGADIIWGHHVHVLQRMEWLTSNVEDRGTLVLYSLGNLFSDQFMLADTQRSALIQVSVKNGSITNLRVIPVGFDWDTLALNFTLDIAEQERILDRLNVNQLDTVEVEVYSTGD